MRLKQDYSLCVKALGNLGSYLEPLPGSETRKDRAQNSPYALEFGFNRLRITWGAGVKYSTLIYLAHGRSWNLHFTKHAGDGLDRAGPWATF